MDLFWESVNARKTFVCALYRHEKQLPKTALGSQGAAPGAANVWLLPMALLGWQLPEMAPGSRKWLPSCSCVEPIFLASLVASCVWCDSPGRLQELPVRVPQRRSTVSAG